MGVVPCGAFAAAAAVVAAGLRQSAGWGWGTGGGSGGGCEGGCGGAPAVAWRTENGVEAVPQTGAEAPS